jgi:hypothetical protein
MAFPIIDGLRQWIPCGVIEAVAEKFLVNGLLQVIDLAMLDGADLHELFPDDDVVLSAVTRARDDATRYKHGWCTLGANLVSRSSSSSSPATTVHAEAASRVGGKSKQVIKTCTKKVMAACSSFAARTLFGKVTSSKPPEVAAMSLALIEKNRMAKAKADVHKVFVKHASGTPRFLKLREAGDLGLNLQMDTYRLKSRSSKVVSRRAKMAENFSLDLLVLEWDILALDEFQIASWARGRVQGGGGSAASHTREVLLLVQACTDVPMFVGSPLVQSQLCRPLRDNLPEAAEQAKELPIEVIKVIENLVFTAPTSQMRCYCGFFALLASSSLRTTDCLRTRRLSLTDDAITGVSQMKTKSTWTK